MTNVAIILAGGIGSRVGAKIPKQFIEVLGRPVLAYTLECFEQHPLVDAIEVVCINSYIDRLKEIIATEKFKKIRWITQGGASFQESVINGINNLKAELSNSDQVLIHYGASPMVSADIITDAINICKEHGNASPASSQIYLAAKRSTPDYSDEWVNRDDVMCLNSPQVLNFGYLKELYRRSEELGLLNEVEPHTTSLMLALHERIYFSKNTTSNIKITTKDDLALFEGWLLRQRFHKANITEK